MTSEQRIRGADAVIDMAILVSGYDERALADLNALARQLGETSDRALVRVMTDARTERCPSG